MKNLHYISALLCAVALTTGCSNEEIMQNGEASSNDFTLIATTGANTRTSVGTEDFKVNWTTDDAFYAFGGAVSEQDKVYKATAEFKLKSGSGTEGTFEGKLTGEKSDLQYAVYPLSAYTPGTMTVTFPTEYTYPNSNAPMFGKLNGDQTKVEFNQLLSGLMRIKLSNLEDNASGTLKLAATGIEGSATLSIAGDGAASLTNFSNGQTGTVTLNFKKPSGSGVLVLDIPVPAATYADGITATLQIGEASAEVFKTTTNFDMKVGTVKEMPAISVIEIDGSTGGIVFSKVVETAADAVKALEAGEKNITISEVKANDEITIPATSTSDAPAVINISKVSSSFTVKGTNGSTGAVKINVPEGSTGTLTVQDIEHVEISGDWTKVTSSTGANTLVVKAGAVVKELTVTKGNIEIETGAVVNKLILAADVTINKALTIPASQKMEVVLSTYTLTLSGDYTRIAGELALTGDESSKGKVTDAAQGIALTTTAAKFTMKNVEYNGIHKDANGIFMDPKVSNTAIVIENSTMTSKYYCVTTNATKPVGTGNTITLKNSSFTAEETPLMVNIPATVTATGCTFTGGWQAAFLRGGTTTFDKCEFNLNVSNSYGSSNIAAGATAWKDGNNAPTAAITAGNRGGSAYDYKTTFELKNSCSFTVKVDGETDATYPAIYIDAEANKDNQGVIFKYDENSKTSFDAAGTGLDIRNITGKVTVNGESYTGKSE